MLHRVVDSLYNLVLVTISLLFSHVECGFECLLMDRVSIIFNAQTVSLVLFVKPVSELLYGHFNCVCCTELFFSRTKLTAINW